jgi:hypothetical protein
MRHLDDHDAAVKPLNFSGAPALLLAQRAAAAWRGMMLPTAPRDDDTPDFVSADGAPWFTWYALDFDNPQTDYDHLCARLQHGGGAAVCVARGATESRALGFRTSSIARAIANSA